MMEIVSVSPHVKGEVCVYSDDMPYHLVEADRLEEGEVGHIVELDEQTYNIECMNCPS